jgi:large subunit ribosomal protein L3
MSIQLLNRHGAVGKKLGMTHLFRDNGQMVAVTAISIDDCIILGSRAYEDKLAIQVAGINANKKHIAKSVGGIFEKAGVEPKRCISSFFVDKGFAVPEVGSVVGASHFTKGQYIDVSAKSIGKGFAGAMKRHNFGGLRASHGVSISHRAHGSTGQCQDPGKVFKGKKMAGRLGGKKTTVENLAVVDIDEQANVIFVKGSIPGHNNSIVIIRDAIKKGGVN